MNKSTMKLMRIFRDRYLDPNVPYTILDIGSKIVTEGHDCYRSLFPPPNHYVGMDIEPGSNVDIVGYDELSYFSPFDIVISGNTMEHIKRPWEWLKSITKYFTKYICIVAPHTLHQHSFPIDCYRFMPDGMRDIFEYAEIEVLDILKGRDSTMGIGKHK